MENSVKDLVAQLNAELETKRIRSVEMVEANTNYSNVITITIAKCYSSLASTAQVKYIKGICDVICTNSKARKMSSVAASFIINAAKNNPSIIFEIQ